LIAATVSCRWDAVSICPCIGSSTCATVKSQSWRSPCAKPWALVKGKPGARLEFDVEFQNGRRHLPIVRLMRAA
jgi:hypothetical protein